MGQLIFTMIGIVAGTVILCWFFNNTFLESYYIYNKQKELLSGYNMVNAAGRRERILSQEFDVTFENICDSGNINMLILDENELLLRSSYSDTQWLQMQLDNMIYGTDREKVTVVKKTDRYLLQRQTDERLGSEYLVFWGKLDNGGYVYMRTALESIHESADITNRFFAMVSAGAIVISIFVIVFLSGGISKPLRSLADISRRMTELDFDAKYTSGQYGSREIDELGFAMNEMSETLEHTISELKTANVSLQNDISKKEQIDEMRKDFLSNVSHELKTPIALIQGYAEGLRECVNEDEKSREYYCDVIVDEAEKMNRMVKQLLTLNQLEFGNDTVEMVRFDIVEMIHGLVASSALIAEQKGAVLRFEQANPLYVWGEPFGTEEVLTNYLSNALNHVGGERRIKIWLTPRENAVRVSVFNTGEQIPEEEMDKIWIKFYKVDKARSREYGGSGIGLSIVKAIMDSFHQQCGVINHGDGVEFWMELEK